jgi:hypothetical protein
MWAVVFLHRSIAFGASIADEQLGSAIWQLGKHFERCGMPYKSQSFKFDPKVKYGGRPTTYHELTAWLLKPIHSKVREFAQPWNKATNAMIQYQIDQTDEKWTAMKKAVEIARRPFWSG